MESTIKPFVGQPVMFHPHTSDNRMGPKPGRVSKVWGETCVNITLDTTVEVTSVFYVATADAPGKPDGYYCHPGEATLVQPAIVGYRRLNQVEADLMNAIKMHGLVTQQLIDRIGSHLAAQGAAAELEGGDGRGDEEDRIHAAEPARWLAMGRTDLQVGLMKLVRAVAQPGGF